MDGTVKAGFGDFIERLDSYQSIAPMPVLRTSS